MDAPAVMDDVVDYRVAAVYVLDSGRVSYAA